MLGRSDGQMLRGSDGQTVGCLRSSKMMHKGLQTEDRGQRTEVGGQSRFRCLDD